MMKIGIAPPKEDRGKEVLLALRQPPVSGLCLLSIAPDGIRRFPGFSNGRFDFAVDSDGSIKMQR